MKPSNLIITIPEPCHEDWNAMTPDNTGKFCGSCCKSVIDFSNKTDAEIKNILMDYKHKKVCGHFKKSQINRPLNITIDFNQLPKNMSSTKVFAVALFFVFGTLLFSCTDFKGQKIDSIEVVNTKDKNYTMGEMAVPKMQVIPEDTTDLIYTKGDVVCTPESYVNGGLRYYQVPEVKDTLMPDFDNVTTGSIAVVMSTEKDSIKNFDTISTKKIDPDIDTTILNSKKNLIVFPNPTSGNFTIKYSVLKPADVSIDILNQQGALVKTVVNVANQYEGIYQIPVSISEFANGIYFVNLVKNGKRSTEKIILEK